MTIYLEYKGAPTSITDLMWKATAPCGCISGAMRVTPARITPESAKSDMNDGKARRIAKDLDEYQIMTYGEYRALIAAGVPSCPHLPAWGIE